jgi:hypothetical protein
MITRLLSIFLLFAVFTPTTRAQTILHGTVTNKQHQPIYNTYILLKGSPWGTLTDSAGHYRIDITQYLSTTSTPVVEFQTQGYAYVQYTPPANATGEVLYNLRFTKPRRHTHKHAKHH